MVVFRLPLLIFMGLLAARGFAQCPGLGFTTQPQSEEACPGETGQFSVVGTGTGTLTYQWFKDGASLSGETGATLSFSPVSENDYDSYHCVLSDDCGSVSSNTVTLSRGQPLTIDTQPTNETVCSGFPASFSVVATGDTLSYQWRKSCVPIAGATSATYSIAAAMPADAGDYDCVVANDCGSLTSNSVSLTVDPNAPSISAQPADATVCPDASVVLAVTVLNPGASTFQWYKDGMALSGKTNTTLSLANVAAADEGDYFCRITHPCGSLDSVDATLALYAPAVVDSQPENASACPDEDVLFSVTASGTAPLSYQWYLNGLAVPGATAADYTVTASEATEGTYHCVVGDACGSVNSDTAALTLIATGALTTQPDDYTVCPGSAVSFSVVAQGAGPFTYQWRKDCETIPGATSATLSFPSVVADDLATYTCVVSSSCGSVTSEQGSLMVRASPLVGLQPTGATVCPGASLSLGVSASGTAPLSYQWRKDGLDLAGATETTLALNSIGAGDAGVYDCVITNLCGATTSAQAAVLVNTAPMIDVDPATQTVCSGENATFSVNASGTAPLSYQWRKAGSNLPGETAATLSLLSVDPADAGAYDCVVSNLCGSLASASAQLTVQEGPSFSSQPTGILLCPDEPASFSVAVVGMGPFDYQWQKDCVPIAGATEATYAIAATAAADLGTYACVVTSACGVITSNGAALTFGVSCNVTTPDPALQAALVNGSYVDDMGMTQPIDTNGDGMISQEEAGNVRGTLDLSDLGLTDLSGLSAFPNLTGLNCSGNKLTRLPEDLLLLTLLEELNAANNAIETLPDLSVLVNLTLLNLSGNLLTSPLTRGALFPDGLEELYLDGNHLTELPNLANLVNLAVLSVQHNRLTQVTSLRDDLTIGDNAQDRILLAFNLLSDDDCTVLNALNTRVTTSGATLSYSPQYDFGPLVNWPATSILNLMNNLSEALTCPPAPAP